MKLVEMEKNKMDSPLRELYQIEPECVRIERDALFLVSELLEDIEDPYHLKEMINTLMTQDPSVQGKIAKMLQKGMKEIIENEKHKKE